MILNRNKSSFIDTLPYVLGNQEQFAVLPSASLYKAKIIELIKLAKKRIYITALYLQDDEAGKEILEALYQAKQTNPNLDVNIFVDYLRAQRGLMGHAKSIGNVRLYREYADKFEHEINIYGVPVKTKEFLGVLHLKGLVFDDTLLYTGASINNVYLHQHERYRFDRYHVIESTEVASAFVRFLRNVLMKSKAVKLLTHTDLPKTNKMKTVIKKLKIDLRRADFHFPSSSSLPDKTEFKITPLLGFGVRKNKLNQSIVELIRMAEKEVTIFTPYFNFPLKVSRAVKKQLKQNKKVTIVVGDKTANDFFIPVDQPFNKIGILPYIYETSLRRFVKANQAFIDQGNLDICLWLDPGNSFHLKGVSSDSKNHLLTGHNINPRAWRLDLENGVLIQDENQVLIEKFNEELKNIKQHCTRISHVDNLDSIDDYPAEAKKLLKNVKRAKLDSILNRLL